MSDPVKRVENLIARAVDASITTEEARTSALIACMIIHKEGLKVVSTEGRHSDLQYREHIYKNLRREVAERESPFDYSLPYVPDGFVFTVAKMDVIVFNTFVKNICRTCGEACPAGSRVVNVPGYGVHHTACWGPPERVFVPDRPGEAYQNVKSGSKRTYHVG